jgi:hypothetical protein
MLVMTAMEPQPLTNFTPASENIGLGIRVETQLSMLLTMIGTELKLMHQKQEVQVFTISLQRSFYTTRLPALFKSFRPPPVQPSLLIYQKTFNFLQPLLVVECTLNALIMRDM